MVIYLNFYVQPVHTEVCVVGLGFTCIYIHIHICIIINAFAYLLCYCASLYLPTHSPVVTQYRGYPQQAFSQRGVRVSFGHPIADFGHPDIHIFWDHV